MVTKQGSTDMKGTHPGGCL